MKKQPVNGAGLHKFIASGGKPADYKGTKGITPETVNKKSDNKKK